ncbi:helix-turn-helix domain-containing protein [Streptomyces xinghaiensis]|uniref:helix-turn-helix domain-containing protein n=1 Tax=Streptomyces xinghaiensis TaxID=1038928 RepID=UPI0037B5D70C
MNPEPEQRWLFIPEAAAYLGASERQVRRWLAQKRIPHTRLGNRVQFTHEQLDAFIAAHTFHPDDRGELCSPPSAPSQPSA